MNATDFSAIAAAISATCALFTLYIFRSQSKGVVWTKDHQSDLLLDNGARIHLQIKIPLFNFGKGHIKFISLRAKKINMKTKAMENFELDMDEAYFPGGASIITYSTTIHTELESDENSKYLIARIKPINTQELAEHQRKINLKLANIPEHILILKCQYKDGSWFGKRNKESVISLTVNGLNINYLSTKRRKELNEYFAW